MAGGRLLDELYKVGDAARALRNWERAELARFIPRDEVEAETSEVADYCRSNDAHVIALARLSGARRLCSADQLLHADFGDPELVNNPRGRVYQYKSQARNLLTHDGQCPLNAPAANARRGHRRR